MKRHELRYWDGNTWTDFAGSARLGLTGVRDVLIANDRMTRCGSTAGNGMVIYNADFLTVLQPKFIDCGTGVGGASNAIDFDTGTSSNVVIDGIEVSEIGRAHV